MATRLEKGAHWAAIASVPVVVAQLVVAAIALYLIWPQKPTPSPQARDSAMVAQPTQSAPVGPSGSPQAIRWLAGMAAVLAASGIFQLVVARRTAPTRSAALDPPRDPAPPGTIQLIEARPDPPPVKADIRWKRKLRVILRNATQRPIEVSAPDWLSSGRGSIPFQPPFWSILENEAAGGWRAGKWKDETPSRLVVPANGIFRASVGLHDHFTIDEINNRLPTYGVGTMVLPLKIGDQEMEWRIAL
jgi:hypothetical protein